MTASNLFRIIRPFRKRLRGRIAPTLVIAILSAVTLLGVRSASAWQSETVSSDAYEAAKLVPADVSFFACFSDAETVLKTLLNSDVGDGVKAFYDRSNGGRIWRDLAEEIGLPPDDLFKIVLSKRLILVMRHDARLNTTGKKDMRGNRLKNSSEQERPREPSKKSETGAAHRSPQKNMEGMAWVALCSTDHESFRRVLRTLDADVVRWIDRTPVYGSPQRSSLQVAYRDQTMILGSKTSQSLFDEIVTAKFATPLSDSPEFLEAVKTSVGQISIFTRPGIHRNANEWTGVSIDLSSQGSTIRSTHFEPSSDEVSIAPSAREKYRVGLDLSPLDRVNDGALVVIVERFSENAVSDIGSSAITSPFVKKQPLVLRYVGPTLFTVIDAREGSPSEAVQVSGVEAGLKQILQPRPQQIRVAWGIELKKPWDIGYRKMDDLLLASLNALKLCVDHPEQLRIPDSISHEPGSVQWVDLTPCSKVFLNSFPGLDRMELHWSMVKDDDNNRAWWLCATDLDMLNDVGEALKRSTRLPSEVNELAVGVIDGPAAAALLDSWTEVNAGTQHPLFSRLFYLEEILKSVPRIHWIVREKPNQRTETEVKIDWGF